MYIENWTQFDLASFDDTDPIIPPAAENSELLTIYTFVTVGNGVIICFGWDMRPELKLLRLKMKTVKTVLIFRSVGRCEHLFFICLKRYVIK